MRNGLFSMRQDGGVGCQPGLTFVMKSQENSSPPNFSPGWNSPCNCPLTRLGEITKQLASPAGKELVTSSKVPRGSATAGNRNTHRIWTSARLNLQLYLLRYFSVNLGVFFFFFFFFFGGGGGGRVEGERAGTMVLILFLPSLRVPCASWLTVRHPPLKYKKSVPYSRVGS